VVQVLAQGGDEGGLAQRHGHGAVHGFKGLLLTGLARQHFHHVQAKTAVHQARQHADLGMAEQLFGKLRRARAARQPAQVWPPSAPLGQLDRLLAPSLKGSVANWRHDSAR
jgi:hypothetical protein